MANESSKSVLCIPGNRVRRRKTRLLGRGVGAHEFVHDFRQSPARFAEISTVFLPTTRFCSSVPLWRGMRRGRQPDARGDILVASKTIQMHHDLSDLI